jgi:hypothetical protein
MGAFFLASVLQSAFIWVLATTYVPLGLAGGTPPGAPAPGTALPAVASAGAAVLGGLAGGVLTVPIQVVAVRALVDNRRDTLPEQLLFRKLGWATLRLFVDSLLKTAAIFVVVFVGTITVLIGALVAFALLPASLGPSLLEAWYAPVLFLPAALVVFVPMAFVIVTFAFVEQEIAVRDATAVQAFVRSWRVVSGNRLRLLAAIVVPYAVNVGFSQLVTRLMPDVTFRSSEFLLMQAVISAESAVVSIVLLGIVTQAWVQLTGIDGPLAAFWAADERGSTSAAPGDPGAQG